MTLTPSVDQDREVLHGLSSWTSSGRAQLQGLLSQALSQAQHISNQNTVNTLLLSILRHHLLSRRAQDAEPAKVFVQVYNSSNSDTSQELCDLLLDAIWTIDEELESRHELLSTNSKDPSLSLDSNQNAHPVTLSNVRSRLAELVGQLVAGQVLTEEQACQRLEPRLLVLAGLYRDDNRFEKRAIQIRTGRFFKLQKFNLLREENEGYTALVTEVLSNLGPSTLPSRVGEAGHCQPFAEPSDPTIAVLEQESPAQRNQRARRVINNVQALIGYFSLDANRVLDIILDLFAFNLTCHYPFFLALFFASPWGPDSEQPQTGADSHYSGVNLNLSQDTGNRICAQLLGHKMAHYCHQDTKESKSEDLYLATALLIKHGLVRFADLYPHLSPGEEGMQKLLAKHRQALSAKASSARSNALSMAAPLANEAEAGVNKPMAPNGTSETDLKDPPNQILGLLRAMLALGDIRHSLFILTRYPWLCAAYDEIADSFLRLLKIVLKPAYNEICTFRTYPAASPLSVATPKPRWDAKLQSTSPPTPRRLIITRCVPEPLPSANLQTLFFYAGWHTDLPSCRTLQDVLTVFLPLLKVLGVSLWRDAGVLQQLCRLTVVGMKLASDDTAQRQSWLDVLRHHILPAVSLSPSNSGILSEIWKIFSLLPYEERFSLYGQWKYDLYQAADLRAAQAGTDKEAKGILKRISKDNLKQSGRNLAKASHSNPTIFFTVALNQVQAYDNLIQPLVESAKYLSNLEYDIFAFNLVDALSNPEKERTKQDGTNISLWLKSLASFCGTLFRRYALMDCIPVLQYLVNQLKANNSKDLVIVSELITKMSGIEPLANLADSQIAALTGGRLLHMEAMMAANALTGSKERLTVRRSGQRLLNALVGSKLAVPLLLLVAQQRQACIHLVPESEAHLKYLGNLYDSCQEVLLQYIEFLYNHLETPEYASIVPSLADLGGRFGIEPAIAFYIARPKLVHSMKQVEAAEAAERLRAELTAGRDKPKAIATDLAGDDVDMTPSETKPELSKLTEESRDAEMSVAEAPASGVPGILEDLGPNKDVPTDMSDRPDVALSTPWHAGLEDATKAALTMLPAAAHTSLGVHFYVTFWQLGLADINVPFDRYHQETKRLKVLISESPVEEQKKRLQDTVNQLDAEMKEQTKSHEVTRKRLRIEKDHWFPETVDRDDVVVQLIQFCLFPRALLSPTDAIFAGKFLRRMHDLGTQNFRSWLAYDKLFGDHIATVVFSSTENEARNYSRFLYTVLADLASWHRSSKAYAKEVIGERLPGFQKHWRNRHGGEEIPAEDLLTWEDYRISYCRWQKNLQRAFLVCLDSKEYMRIRNAIVIMTRIAPLYPILDAHGNEVMSVVEKLGSTELRGDLKILAQGLLATLKARKKEWIPEHKARRDPRSAISKTSQAPKSNGAAAEAVEQPAVGSQLSEDDIEFVSVKLKSNAPIDQADRPDATRTAAPENIDRTISSSNDKTLLAKLPPGVVLPSRPATAPRRSEANNPRNASRAPGNPVNEHRSGEERDLGARPKPQLPASDENQISAGKDRDITGTPHQAEKSDRPKAEEKDERLISRSERPSTSTSSGAASKNEGTPDSRPSNLPLKPPQSSRDVPATHNRGDWEDDRPAAGDNRRKPQDNNSASGSLPRQSVPLNPPSARSNTPAESGAGERDLSERVTSSVGPSRRDVDRDQDLRIRDRATRDRADRERIDRDRAGPRDRDHVRESRPQDDRQRSLLQDADGRRNGSSRDRDRERDRDRRGDRGRTERDDRRSRRSSRNPTPAAEAAVTDRGSGHNTPLGSHRDRERDPVSVHNDRDRERVSSQTTPAALDDGGDSRKRTLAGRLTSASNWDQPAEEDPSKRMRLSQNFRAPDMGNSTIPEARPSYAASRPLVPDSRASVSESSRPYPDLRPSYPDSRTRPPDTRPTTTDSRSRFPAPLHDSRIALPDLRLRSQDTRSPAPDARSADTRPALYSSRPSSNDDFRQAPHSNIYSSRPPVNNDYRQAPHEPMSHAYGHGRQNSRDTRSSRDYRDDRRDRSARRAGNA